MNDHFSAACKRFRHRLHRQVPTEELRAPGVLAEDEAANVRVQPVGADDDVERARRRVLEGHVAVGGDGRDRVAEQVLDVVTAGVVVGLAEIVAHDLHVPVGCGAGEFGEIDVHGPPIGPSRYIVRSSVPVASASIRVSTPIFSEISIAGRNRSTAWPPVLRSAGARSTTVTSNPWRVSQ